MVKTTFSATVMVPYIALVALDALTIGNFKLADVAFAHFEIDKERKILTIDAKK